MHRWTALRCALLASASVSGAAHAQLAAPAPVRQSIDANGVDLFAGTMNVDAPALTIGGADPQGLSYHQLTRGNGWTDNVTATLTCTLADPLDVSTACVTTNPMVVSFGGTSDNFTISGTTFTATQGNGATLTLSAGIYTYMRTDGTKIHFSKSTATATPYYSNQGRVTDVTLPSGDVLTYGYDSLAYCAKSKPSGGGSICLLHATAYRISTITNSYGYKLTLGGGDAGCLPCGPDDTPDFAAWSGVLTATVTNLAVASGASTPTQTFATTTSGGNTYFTVTDPMGRVTYYRESGSRVLGVVLPGSTTENETITYSGTTVSSVASAATGTTGYAYADASGVRTTTVTDALGHQTVYKFDIASQLMTSVTDALGHKRSMFHDSYGRTTQVTQSEGQGTTTVSPCATGTGSDCTVYTYDGNGNVTNMTMVPKYGSGLANISTSATYPCTSAATCNKPLTTTDAKGYVTNYSWDATTGNLNSVTLPAPTSGAVRPQVNYHYATYNAWFYPTVGAPSRTAGPNIVLSDYSWTCRTLASCTSGTALADQTKTSVVYPAEDGSVPNNLLPVSTTIAAGDGSLSATTSYTYDDIGNPYTVQGPLGANYTTRYRYDADRELVGAVGPDPDYIDPMHNGPLLNRAVRITYDPSGTPTANLKGLVTLVEQGTVPSQSDADWANFKGMRARRPDYDGARRTVSMTSLGAAPPGGGGYMIYALTQYGYDTVGRPQCTTVRMNIASYGALPGACTQTSGTGYLPDRISQTSYDNANRPTTVATGVGTALARNELNYTYSANGMAQTLSDARNNLTTYVYDGFDRLSQTFYPSPTTPGTSSTTDYEQLTYDLNSNVQYRRLRDGQTLGFAFDNLNRVTHQGGAIADRDITYDLQNRMLSNTFNTGGQSVSFTYDALGRMINQVQPGGTMVSAYDVAGRRIQLSWPDGFYARYGYDNVSEMVQISGKSSTGGADDTLATYSYDDLGRRTQRTLPNVTNTSYAYDSTTSWLTNLNFNGGSYTNAIGLSGYNPAGEIGARANAQDLYSWTGGVTGTKSYTANGLNQYSAISGSSLTHDARGNITSVGGISYTYDANNLMKTAGSISFGYDPIDRIYSLTATGVGVTWLYDGDHVASELNTNAGGAIKDRYIFGPGDDEPVVWYQGAGYDSASRYFMEQDERGSVARITASNSGLYASNSYDEYGNPGSGNLGRFQYTGQMTLSGTANLYYYKARVYNPAIGRFMQTDPIGYGDGPNWYNYAHGNPVNGSDPSGTDTGSLLNSCGQTSGCTSYGGGGPGSNAANDAAAAANGGGDGSGSGAGPGGIGTANGGPLGGGQVYSSSNGQSWSDGGYLQTPDGNYVWISLGSGSSGAFSGGFSPQHVGLLAGDHDYTAGPNLICPASWGCSASLVGSTYSQISNAIPGNTSAGSIVSGNSYTVSLAGVPVGEVQSYVGSGGLTVNNITQWDHVLAQGFANRNAYQSGGSWYSFTHGSGTNYYGGAFMAVVNQLAGPGIFNSLDRSIANQLYNATHH